MATDQAVAVFELVQPDTIDPNVHRGQLALLDSSGEPISGDLAVPEPPAPAQAVADATDAEDVVAQFNALLASLRAAGYLAE